MEIPYRAGQAAAVLGMAMLALGSLANVILIPIVIVGLYGGARALGTWSALDSDAPLWAGVALGASVLISAFATISSANGWLIWSLTTTALLTIGLFAARDHVARNRRRWRLERELKSNPGSQHAERRTTPSAAADDQR
jgi:4-amino-4-deoxy-L-arabinose transferase-like glycosyltransferase